MSTCHHAPLIVILGPTAVGKTEIAVRLAEALGGEIVSADSRLFYRGMDIGTAKPSPSELARVPHHLVNVSDPDQIWSLALFQKAAHQAIQAIHQRERLPFLVGGTGQYIRAVTEGWDLPQVKPDARLRGALERWSTETGAQGLFQRLEVLDPQAAASMDPSNVRRTVRALEVILSTGRLFSQQKRRLDPPYNTLQVGLWRPRQELYARIDARIQAMLEAGLVDEVRQLLEKGYSPELPTLSAIGYGEMVAFLEGEITLEEAVAQMKRKTRIFVRRQANWFKQSDPEIHWFRADHQVVNEIQTFIEGWLSQQL